MCCMLIFFKCLFDFLLFRTLKLVLNEGASSRAATPEPMVTLDRQRESFVPNLSFLIH